MAKKFPIFNKYFIILMAVNFSVAFSYYITFVTTTSYAINVLHTSNALAGLAKSLGYKAMYQICAGLVFIVLILYFFLIFKRKNC